MRNVTLCMALLLSTAYNSPATAQSPSPRDAHAQNAVSVETIDRALELATAYLLKQAKPNGQFTYRINTNAEVTVQPKYNMLRHAGAMFALADVQSLHPNTRAMQVLLSANEFLTSQIAPAANIPEVAAVWSDPKVNLGNDPLKAKLGGAGLSLVAMCSLERLQAKTAGIRATDERTLMQLGNFLLFMQKNDGSFYSICHPDFPHQDDSWTSLYYPGEAALGMLMLNDVDPDETWIAAASEALTYLAKSRAGKQAIPADHWALIATQHLLAIKPVGLADGSSQTPATSANTDPIVVIDRKLLLSHARQIASMMLAEQQPQNGHPSLDGCFVADGRTTPTATRLEGLLAVLSCLPNPAESDSDSKLRDQIETACHRGIRFLINSQIKTGSAAGGVPRASLTLEKNHPLWNPNANERATEIRIDYVQHAMSAWIAYRNLLAERPVTKE